MPSFLRDSQIISQNQVRRKNNVKDIVQLREYDILTIWENHRAKAALPLFFIRRVQSSPPDERKEGDSMVTYSELIQTGIFIVALVGLCYTIFKGKRK